MYQALLTNRYLSTRIIPFIAVAAVALCVALVIIVVSVMTGFLNLVRTSGKTLMGDVVISAPHDGLPHYDALIEKLDGIEQVFAATPVTEHLGLLKMPYDEIHHVQMWGIEPESFAKVTGYGEALYWRETTQEQREWLLTDLLMKRWNEVRDVLNAEERLAVEHLMASGLRNAFAVRDVVSDDSWQALVALDPRIEGPAQILKDGLSLTTADGRDNTIVPGMHVSIANERQSDGTYASAGSGRFWSPRHQVTLTTLPVSRDGSISTEPEERILRIVNEFMSGVFVVDQRRVMIPLHIAQEMMHLDEAEIVEERDGVFEVVGTDPARCSLVLVRARDDVAPEELVEVLKDAYAEFVTDVARDDPALEYAIRMSTPESPGGTLIQTWEQQQAAFIGPVEKERELMRTLFSLIYLVCAGLVLSIFWAIVYEKTRDIGILRSIGASRLGIVWIFLRYGMVIGVVGAVGGLGLGALVVHNINSIHDGLGDPPIVIAIAACTAAAGALVFAFVRSAGGRILPTVLGGLIFITLGGIGAFVFIIRNQGGIVIWDPAIYYFDEIPNAIDWQSTTIAMIGGAVFSVIGASLPAAKAADTDPVRALRYE